MLLLKVFISNYSPHDLSVSVHTRLDGYVDLEEGARTPLFCVDPNAGVCSREQRFHLQEHNERHNVVSMILGSLGSQRQVSNQTRDHWGHQAGDGLPASANHRP
jgi:hypothetical protein